MSDEIVAATDDSWFDNQLREWADKGWDIEEVADYLNESSANATEALMRVESVSYTHLTLPTKA